MSRTNRTRSRATNRDSRIVSVFNGARVATRTIYRSPFSIRASVITDCGATTLRIKTAFGSELFFTGSEARTLYRTLQNHYKAAELSY